MMRQHLLEAPVRILHVTRRYIPILFPVCQAPIHSNADIESAFLFWVG